MSQAVPETVWTCDIDGRWMNIEVFGYIETVWTSAWLLELAYSLIGDDVEMLLAVPETVWMSLAVSRDCLDM